MKDILFELVLLWRSSVYHVLLCSQCSSSGPLSRKEMAMSPFRTQTSMSASISLWLARNSLFCHKICSKSQRSNFLGFPAAPVPPLTLQVLCVQLCSCTVLAMCKGHPSRSLFHHRHSLSCGFVPASSCPHWSSCLQPAQPSTALIVLLPPLTKSNTGVSCAEAVSHSTSSATYEFKVKWKPGRVICKTSSVSSPFCACPEYKNIWQSRAAGSRKKVFFLLLQHLFRSWKDGRRQLSGSSNRCGIIASHNCYPYKALSTQMENKSGLILQSAENPLLSLIHLNTFIAELIIEHRPATMTAFKLFPCLFHRLWEKIFLHHT